MQLSVPHDELIPLPQRGITLGAGGKVGPTEHQIQPPLHASTPGYPLPSIICHVAHAVERIGAGQRQGQNVHPQRDADLVIADFL